MATPEWRSKREAAAYVAGLFDGEGCVMHTRHRGFKATYTRGIEISNGDPVLIDAGMSALAYLDIHAKVYVDATKRQPNWMQINKIRIHQRPNLERFLEVVPFRSPAKRAKLIEAVTSYQTHYRRVSDPAFRGELAALWADPSNSTEDIARHFECAPGSVYRWLRKAGIPPRSESHSRRATPKHAERTR